MVDAQRQVVVQIKAQQAGLKSLPTPTTIENRGQTSIGGAAAMLPGDRTADIVPR
jgi:hypothetical protein